MPRRSNLCEHVLGFSRDLSARNRRHTEVMKRLSAKDQSMLKQINPDPLQKCSVSPDQANRFIELGLAELSYGRLVLTRSGVTALAVVREFQAKQ